MSNDKLGHTANMAWEGYDLSQGVSNRLFLSLRSGIPDEVDWALHRLLAVSFERQQDFALKRWPGSVETLFEVVEEWVADVRARWRRAAADVDRVIESHDEIDRERRATDALLVLRNAASLMDSNKTSIAGVVARPSMAPSRRYLPPRFLLDFNELFGTADRDDLMALTLRSPEPVIYLLDLFQACMPQFCPGHPLQVVETHSKPPHPTTVDMLQRLMVDVLPDLFLRTTDLGIIVPLIQIYINSPQPFTPPLDVLAPKLLPFLLLTPTGQTGLPTPYPRGLLLFSLDLLYTLTVHEAAALALLKLPDAAHWIKVLLGLTAWNTKRETRSWTSPTTARLVQLPHRSMSHGGIAAVPDDDGSPYCAEPFGLGPVLEMPQQERERLRRLPEPQRCREWIARVFVQQPQSSITQVTFWTTYKAMTTPDTGIAALTAAEAIKQVSEVFPGAVAMVINQDEAGRPLRQPRFIIQGVRFKRSAGRRETYTCRWQDCQLPLGAVSSAELITHLQSHHLASHPPQCRWGTCMHGRPTLQHVTTHVPGPIDASREPTPVNVAIHPSTPIATLRSPFLTSRLPPPPDVQLQYKEIQVPRDVKRQPVGEAFLATATLRNLARALRREVRATADGAFGGKTRRKLESGEVYGLPVPPGYLDAREEEATVRLTDEERERAVGMFRGIVENEALELVSLAPLGQYVVDCVGL